MAKYLATYFSVPIAYLLAGIIFLMISMLLYRIGYSSATHFDTEEIENAIAESTGSEIHESEIDESEIHESEHVGVSKDRIKRKLKIPKSRKLKKIVEHSSLKSLSDKSVELKDSLAISSEKVKLKIPPSYSMSQKNTTDDSDTLIRCITVGTVKISGLLDKIKIQNDQNQNVDEKNAS